MAETDSKTPDTPQPAAKPYGPGLLMVFGLACAIFAAWCGWELYTKVYQQDQGKDALWIAFNWAGAVGFAIGAVYCFVLATKRSKQPKADSADSESDRPPESGV